MWRAGVLFFRLGGALKSGSRAPRFPRAASQSVCRVKLERKLYSATLFVRLTTVKRKLHRYRSPWKRSSSPDRDVEQITRIDSVGIVVVILLARDSVGTTLWQRDEFRGNRAGGAFCSGSGGALALRRLRCKPIRWSPADSPVRLRPSPASGTPLTTKPLSYRQLNPTQGPSLPELILQMGSLVEFLVMIDTENASAALSSGVTPSPDIAAGRNGLPRWTSPQKR